MAGEGQGLDDLPVLGTLDDEWQDYGVFLGVGTHARDIVRNAVQGQAILFFASLDLFFASLASLSRYLLYWRFKLSL